MTGEINSTFERDINDVILEYFNYVNYRDSFDKFKAELVEKGKSVSKQEFNHNANIDQELLFEYFHNGKKHEFFQFWNKVLSEQLRSEDTVCQKLEFYCHIYFATYLIRKNYDNKELELVAMQEFREYLEARGAKLSKSTEFVRFYALPYVPNPRDHPSFAELFLDSWVPGLELRLKRFFELTIGTVQKEPRILTMYRNSANDEGSKDGLRKLQTRLVESEKRSSNVVRRLNQVQVDYHALIGISAELVDLLEGSLQGNPVSPGHLQHVCQRLLNSQQHRLQTDQSQYLDTNANNSNNLQDRPRSPNKQFSYDLSRPGTASKLLRQSLQAYQKPTVDENKKQLPTQYKNLNFNKIREDIETGDDHLRSLLLQALRWRLTKTDIETREKLLVGMSKHDLLGLAPDTNYHNVIASILNGDNGSATTRQYLARLFNAVSTLNRGRSYLASKTDVCALLMNNIQDMINEESILRENFIGALQKLSLKRSIQTYMITNGMIEWLMDLLESNSNISDYTLDYSVALLMNLCLRSSGKIRCIDHKTRILQVLSKMLNTFNSEIASYVNGALYSILIMPELREEARKMNLEETLKTFMKTDTPDLNRQIQYIIHQMNSNDVPNTDISSDDEEEDDDEDPEILELELDKDECLEIAKGELQGETLLSPKYTTFPSNPTSVTGTQANTNEPPPLSRPVTPGTFMAKKSPSANLQQVDQSVDIERPPTRSGSQQTNNNNSSRPETANSSSSRPKQRPSQPLIENSAEYQNAFGEKPRILRTPYHPNSGSGVTSNNGDAENGKRKESLSGPRPSSGQPRSSANSGTRRSRQSITNSTK